jgi:hypothetical protein
MVTSASREKLLVTLMVSTSGFATAFVNSAYVPTFAYAGFTAYTMMGGSVNIIVNIIAAVSSRERSLPFIPRVLL